MRPVAAAMGGRRGELREAAQLVSGEGLTIRRHLMIWPFSGGQLTTWFRWSASRACSAETALLLHPLPR